MGMLENIFRKVPLSTADLFFSYIQVLAVLLTIALPSPCMAGYGDGSGPLFCSFTAVDTAVAWLIFGICEIPFFLILKHTNKHQLYVERYSNIHGLAYSRTFKSSRSWCKYRWRWESPTIRRFETSRTSSARLTVTYTTNVGDARRQSVTNFMRGDWISGQYPSFAETLIFLGGWTLYTVSLIAHGLYYIVSNECRYEWTAWGSIPWLLLWLGELESVLRGSWACFTWCNKPLWRGTLPYRE